MNHLWLFPLTFLLTNTAYALPTEQQVRQVVSEIIHEREEQVRTKGSELTWQSPICYVVSKQFASEMKKKGLNPFIVRGKNHQTIGIYAVDLDGNDEEFIVDATFRQFFVLPNKDPYLMQRLFEDLHIPKVLVVRRRDIEKVLNSFPIKPVAQFGFSHYYSVVEKWKE